MRKLLLGLVAAAAVGLVVPALAASADPVTTKSVLTQNGLGSIRIGMRVSTARERTGQQFDVTLFTPGDTSCGLGRLSPASLGVTFQTTRSHIAVLNVSNRGIATPTGIQVGDTVKDLKAAYGAKLDSQPNKYTPKAVDYFVTFPNKRKLLFYTNPKGKIGQISGGRMPEIDFVEGCS